MTTPIRDLVERLKAEIDQDELWALAASAPRHPEDGPTVAGGVHWTWSVGGNWEAVTVDPTASYVGEPEGEPCGVTLRTVEAWRLSWGGPDNTLPHNVCEGEEVRTGDGGHIVRHDPARVLRDVTAYRAILERYETAVVARDAAVDTPLAGATRLSLRIHEENVRLLAALFDLEAESA